MTRFTLRPWRPPTRVTLGTDIFFAAGRNRATRLTFLRFSQIPKHFHARRPADDGHLRLCARRRNHPPRPCQSHRRTGAHPQGGPRFWRVHTGERRWGSVGRGCRAGRLRRPRTWRIRLGTRRRRTQRVARRVLRGSGHRVDPGVGAPRGWACVAAQRRPPFLSRCHIVALEGQADVLDLEVNSI